MRTSVALVCLALWVAVTLLGESEGNVAIGRSGSVRPGKRSLALGRFNLRPGKRSPALDRSMFEKLAIDVDKCDKSDIAQVTNLLEYLVPYLEEYVIYLERCTQQPNSPFELI